MFSNIGLCKDNDLPELMSFIDKYWSKDHVLSKDTHLFKFMYYDKSYYNFVISRDNNGMINGILGFIPTYKYDEELKINNDVWLTLWKVRDYENRGLGFYMLKWLEKKYKPISIGAIGINIRVKNIYDILGYRTGNMNHYYIINNCIDNYYIAKNIVPEYFNNDYEVNNIVKKIGIDDLDKVVYSLKPTKSIRYIINRYLNHPYYKYIFLGIYNNNNIVACFVVRKVFYKTSSCLRVVDIIGDINKIGGIKKSILNILYEEKSEYIDCVNFGIPKNIFYCMGFSTVKDDVIIPNYFEPFIQSNNRILYAYKSLYNNYNIFKGDSDQDRPNITI